jgi:hypothetical protein
VCASEENANQIKKRDYPRVKGEALCTSIEAGINQKRMARYT